MLWRNQRESSNIEDRRGVSGRGIAIGGGGFGLLVIVILAVLCGQDPRKLLSQLPSGQGGDAPIGQPQAPPAQDDTRKFVASVLGSTEDAWTDILRREGVAYRKPTLVLFTDSVRSACGAAGASSGPFYCPGDEKLYLDTSFFDQLRREFGAPGDFAQAYVIGHEVGHHVQKLLGTSDQVERAQSRASETQANQLSVRLELQADCYAGIWAKYAQSKGLLETGDIEEALKAAAGVGDDNIQRRTQGYVVPESFTHGSSQDRMGWFNRGFQSGDLRQCNTFGGR
jgi:predicted metalloprotease